MAAKRKLFLGAQIRRLRKERALTQAQMAAELEISPSYINLIERNQRPVSADLLIRVAQNFDLDLSAFASDRTDDLFAQLNSAFGDPLFANAGLTREDAHELAAGNPALADAVATLFRAYRAAQNDLSDARASGAGPSVDPVEDARSFIQKNRNYFPTVDEACERLADRLRLADRSKFEALRERLAKSHRLTVRLLPHDVMVGAYRRLDRHAERVAISEALDHASRAFQLALQVCLLELREELDAQVNEARFASDAGRRLARAALANYAAAALLMPYDRFHRSALELKYDIEALARRFGASFEQVCHRIASLQRPGAEGIAFFFLRFDAAGNISKRFSGDIFPFARYGGSCPLWNIHEAFRTPRRILTQVVSLPDGARYFSIARSVHSGAAGYGAPIAERAVALGCHISDAHHLIYAHDRNLDDTAIDTPIGVTCRLCERTECAARAHPPMKRRLLVDDHRRLAAPFSFAFD